MTIPDKTPARKMEINFQKIQKGTSQYIPIVHYFIVEQEEQPQFYACQTPYNIKYFLIEYKDLALNIFFNTSNMKNLFENVNIEDILSFLR